MTKSDSFNGSFTDVPLTLENRTSTTFYIGAKGDEIASYSWNYKLFGTGAGTDVKTTSFFYYNDKRPLDLTATEQISAAMTKSDSFNGSFTDVPPTMENRTSTTFYIGAKGDEIASYSWN